MTEIKFAGAERDIDEQLFDAKDTAPTDPIKVRVQPQIYQPGSGYSAWRRVAWVISFGSIEDARALRVGLTAFFSLAARLGIGALSAELVRLDNGVAAEAHSAARPPA